MLKRQSFSGKILSSDLLPSVWRVLVMGVGDRLEGMLDKTKLLQQLDNACDVSSSNLVKVSCSLEWKIKDEIIILHSFLSFFCG